MASTSLSFTVSLDDDEKCIDSPVTLPVVPQHSLQSFQKDGFVVVPNVVSATNVDDLNERLEDILRGDYDRGQAPDKTPRLVKLAKHRAVDESVAAVEVTPSSRPKDMDTRTPKTDERRLATATDATYRKTTKKVSPAAGPLGFSGNLQNVKVLQVINVHKSDSLFRKLACCPALGKVVADLMGWKDGARLAQDQVWAKPPGGAPLTYHRDSPYFMFSPAAVATVWIALDHMDPELGPLEYVVGSHKWDRGRVGSANQFFQSNGGVSLLNSAVADNGLSTRDVQVVSMAGLQAGGLSIHNGLTWHGSARNTSRDRPRRGLGLHFVPVSVRFTEEAVFSQLWGHYVEDAEDASQVELPLQDFPISWKPNALDETRQ
jgi:hypothetical protein